MCMIDGVGSYWAFHRSALRRARTPHRCDECRRDIQPGESYERFVGKADYFDTFATCAHCLSAREWLNEWCNGWLYGGVLEDLEEHWAEEPCRSIWLGRAIVGMRRRWTIRGSRVRPLGSPPPAQLAQTRL